MGLKFDITGWGVGVELKFRPFMSFRRLPI